MILLEVLLKGLMVILDIVKVTEVGLHVIDLSVGDGVLANQVFDTHLLVDKFAQIASRSIDLHHLVLGLLECVFESVLVEDEFSF